MKQMKESKKNPKESKEKQKKVRKQVAEVEQKKRWTTIVFLKTKSRKKKRKNTKI